MSPPNTGGVPPCYAPSAYEAMVVGPRPTQRALIDLGVGMAAVGAADAGDTAAGCVPAKKQQGHRSTQCKARWQTKDLAPRTDRRESTSRNLLPSSAQLAGMCPWQSSARIERPLTHMYSVVEPPPLRSGSGGKVEKRDTPKEFLQLRLMRKSLGNVLQLVRNELDRLELADGAQHTSKQPGAHPHSVSFTQCLLPSGLAIVT